MPIYEYDCRSCGQRFEALVLGAQVPECPECHGKDLAKRFSTFSPGGSHAAPPSCERCEFGGPGGCGAR